MLFENDSAASVNRVHTNVNGNDFNYFTAYYISYREVSQYKEPLFRRLSKTSLLTISRNVPNAFNSGRTIEPSDVRKHKASQDLSFNYFSVVTDSAAMMAA